MSLMAFREPNQVAWVGSRPSHRGSQIAVHGGGSNGSNIIHTVSAGKTFFLTTLLGVVNTSATGTLAQIGIRNVSDVTQYFLFSSTFDQVGQLPIPLNFWPPHEIPAGWDIFSFSSAGTLDISVFLHGWEE